MSKLENQTKSVIQHMVVSCSPRTLGVVDIETIAQFAFLKGVVADHSHDNRKPFFTLAERHNFRESLEIPAGFQVWLASMLTQHGLFKGHYFIAPHDVPGRCEINVFTYGLGHFLVQTTTGRWMKKAHRRHSAPPAIHQGSTWATFSIPVWPIRVPHVDWPLLDYVDYEIVDDYAQRWRLLTLNPYDSEHPTGGSLISMPRMIASKAITRRRRRS